ncbi:MAG TPA: protein-L-isoaspartate(D-aspartate) O-methyltransferase [Terriglobales bacterium]|nr:protein-L-isoaspartate(D-aspartate) O-methyltransferase [Terriglobales bacterium]
MISFSQDFDARRDRMVRSQLAARGIHDARVLHAMSTVPRQEFVPENLREDAYEDHPLPIGEDQTISQPYIVAAMLEQLALRSTDRVLEIGTGSGYVTALLSVMTAEVYTVERFPSLSQSATKTLVRLGHCNVHFNVADGREGWPEHAPYDKILVSAATAEVPPALFVQLAEAGCMIIPVGGPTSQELQLIRKQNGKPEITSSEGCRFVPLLEGKVD